MRRIPPLVHYMFFALPAVLVLAGLWAGLGSEAAVARWAEASRAAHPQWTAAAKILTDWGNIAFYLVYAVILIIGLRRGRRDLVRLTLVYVAVQLIIALALVQGLKHALGRPRPGNGALFDPFTSRGGHHSLPSGHTTEITGAALPLGLRWRRPLLSLGLGLVVAVMGLSRVYLGWHHPSDVLFGLALGSVAGLAIHLFSQRNGHV